MSYIECYSHMTGKNVKYNLIGVKLKHQKRDLDYGCSTDNYSNVYCNTSPYMIATYYRPPGAPNSRELKICGTSGFVTQGYDASGILSSEYHNSNTGSNPVISSRTYDIEDMQVGENTEDLFSTDMIKVRITTVKKKASEVIVHNWAYTNFQKLDGTYEDKENLYLISNVVMDFILLSNNEIVGSVDLMAHQYNGFFPTRFSMNSELFNLIDFDPQYQSELAYSNYYSMWFSMSQQTNKGIMVNGSKETTKHDFVGLIHSLLAAEGWYTQRNGYNWKQFQIQKTGGAALTDREINIFNVNGDILFFRHMIQTQPNEFIQFNKGYSNAGLCFTPDAQTAWIDSYMAEKGYVYADPSGTYTTFMANVFNQSPVLMPLYNDMYIPLTNDIKAGEAPDPEPEEEEVTEAIDGNTDWSADQSDGERNYFNHVSSDTIGGDPGAINLYPAGYSNFIFKYFRPVTNAWNKLVAYSFIIDTMVAGTSDVLHSFFRLVTGEPKMSTILGRVYALPFEYDEIYDQSAGVKECCPSYGVMGKCLGTPDPNNNGFSVYHYYDRLVQRFKVLDLGTTTVSKIFLNYLDYATRYTLNLPYAGGEVDIDPSFLFRDKASSGTITLKGYLDFDTGFMVIKVNVNGDLYYETTVNVATDLAVSMTDYGSQMTALGRAVIMAGTAGIMKSGVASTIGRGVKKFIPKTTIEPLPDIPPLGLPEKDIIYGEDKTPQFFAQWVMKNWQETADTLRLGRSPIDYYQGKNPDPPPPRNIPREMGEQIWQGMMGRNRMGQMVADVTFPYSEVIPPTTLGRRL